MRRTLSDREVQPFDKGRVQFRGVLGISKALRKSPVSTDHRSSFDFHNAIVPPRLDDLPVQTRRSKDTADNLRIKGETVRGDQGDVFQIRSAGDIPGEGECVSIASSSHDCRGPKPRPDLNCCEDPNGLFPPVDPRANLVCLELRDGVSVHLSIIEATARMGSPLQPAMNGIPGDSFYPSYRRLAQALDAERGDLVEGRTTMLESMVWRSAVRAERLAAGTATISTTPASIGSVESVTNDVSRAGFARNPALSIWAAGTHNRSLTK